MPKIVEYKIIMAENWNELEHKVKEYIKEGWQPFGYFFVSETYVIIQPLIKYEKE